MLFSRIIDVPIYYRSPEELRGNSKWRWFYFNEVVGYVWLIARPQALRAEYCFIRQRPSRVLVRREFEPRGKLFQISCHGLTNAQIYAKLVSVLGELQSSGFLQSFWLDLGSFQEVGPAINWQQLIARAHT